MKLAFQIAFRFLKSGKLQTLFIILGIGVGVSVQVFIGALIGGLQADLINTTIGQSSQITITQTDDLYIDQYDSLIETILNTDSNLRVATPTISTNGTLIQDETVPVLLRGLDLNTANEIYHFEEKLISGRLPVDNNEILISPYFSETLSIALNDNVTFNAPTLGDTTLTVVGIYDFDVKTINELWAVSNLSTVQSILGLTDVVKTIETQLKPNAYFDAELISTDIQTVIGANYSVSNWIEANGQLLSGLQGQSISSLMIQVFVLVSVVLGISSILAIIVLQKSKQIGILKAMGIPNKDASFIFLFQGLILGVFGAITGVLLGLGLLVSFQTFAIDSTTGEPVIGLLIDPNFILTSALIAVFVSTVAALIPARKSSKLSVIEVIRNA